ncbi:hypothetical protein BV97_01992 [Novosphingobium resinovorum]|jgi:hypothetical protein|uniref:Uncharacterized protein n=1 Tax=Novosphingobium resinovorum TaxID=158500 RepID=A0A031JZT8_9SPHN|nr:hypothetical protein [Novosphingobium resinovorum]EZP82495.1 hypothetical protein BV97_01992 [Novosphingobium resinovorum]
MSAQLIFDTAPLGSLIRYSNGEPRPPERFTRKLKAWNNDNGIGRLVERIAEEVRPTYRSPAGFCLHLGNYGSQGIIAIVMRRHYSVESALHFEIAQTPKPGMVRLLTSCVGRDELRFLAPDMASAQDWLAQNHYTGARFEVVSDPDPVVLPSSLGRAA